VSQLQEGFLASPELLETNWFNTKASWLPLPGEDCLGIVPIGERG
jgi:hypothetical protein